MLEGQSKVGMVEDVHCDHTMDSEVVVRVGVVVVGLQHKAVAVAELEVVLWLEEAEGIVVLVEAWLCLVLTLVLDVVEVEKAEDWGLLLIGMLEQLVAAEYLLWIEIFAVH